MPQAGGVRRRSDVDETTKRLLDAAAAAFVANGYDGSGVSEIARQAGVTTGAIYARWPNKNMLMAAAVEHAFGQILPERRMTDLGIKDMPVTDLISAWSSLILAGDSTQDILVQGLASARSNELVRERLKQFINLHAEQFSQLVQLGKEQAAGDPGFDLTAMTLFMQAAGIGMHLLLSAGLDERHVPNQREWKRLIDALLETVLPTESPPRS